MVFLDKEEQLEFSGQCRYPALLQVRVSSSDGDFLIPRSDTACFVEEGCDTSCLVAPRPMNGRWQE